MNSVFVVSTLVATFVSFVASSLDDAPMSRPDVSGFQRHVIPERCFRLPHPIHSADSCAENQPSGQSPNPSTWFFDPGTGGCRPAPTGNCATIAAGQNGNSFRTLEECVEICTGKSGDDRKSEPEESIGSLLPTGNDVTEGDMKTTTPTLKADEDVPPGSFEDDGAVKRNDLPSNSTSDENSDGNVDPSGSDGDRVGLYQNADVVEETDGKHKSESTGEEDDKDGVERKQVDEEKEAAEMENVEKAESETRREIDDESLPIDDVISDQEIDQLISLEKEATIGKEESELETGRAGDYQSESEDDDNGIDDISEDEDEDDFELEIDTRDQDTPETEMAESSTTGKERTSTTDDLLLVGDAVSGDERKPEAEEEMSLAIDRMNRNMARVEPEEEIADQLKTDTSSKTAENNTEMLVAMERMNQNLASVEPEEEIELPSSTAATESSYKVLPSTLSGVENHEDKTNVNESHDVDLSSPRQLNIRTSTAVPQPPELSFAPMEHKILNLRSSEGPPPYAATTTTAADVELTPAGTSVPNMSPDIYLVTSSPPATGMIPVAGSPPDVELIQEAENLSETDKLDATTGASTTTAEVTSSASASDNDDQTTPTFATTAPAVLTQTQSWNTPSAAAGGHTPPWCKVPPDAGQCIDAVARRWYFNALFDDCVAFAYSGCPGSANNFADEAECRRACHSVSSSGFPPRGQTVPPPPRVLVDPHQPPLEDVKPVPDVPRVEPPKSVDGVHGTRTITIMLPVRYNDGSAAAAAAAAAGEGPPRMPDTQSPQRPSSSFRDFLEAMARKTTRVSSPLLPPPPPPLPPRKFSPDWTLPPDLARRPDVVRNPAAASPVDRDVLRSKEDPAARPGKRRGQEPEVNTDPSRNRRRPAPTVTMHVKQRFWVPPPVEQLKQAAAVERKQKPQKQLQQQRSKSSKAVVKSSQRIPFPSKSFASLPLYTHHQYMYEMPVQKWQTGSLQSQQPWLMIPPPYHHYDSQQQQYHQQQPFNALNVPNYVDHMPIVPSHPMQQQQQESQPDSVFRKEIMMTAISYGLPADDQPFRFAPNQQPRNEFNLDGLKPTKPGRENRDDMAPVHQRWGPVVTERPASSSRPSAAAMRSIVESDRRRRPPSRRRRPEVSSSDDSSDIILDDEDGDVVMYELQRREPAASREEFRRRAVPGGQRGRQTSRKDVGEQSRRPADGSSRRRQEEEDGEFRRRMKAYGSRGRGRPVRPPMDASDERRTASRFADSRRRPEDGSRMTPTVGKLAMFQILVSRQQGIAAPDGAFQVQPVGFGGEMLAQPSKNLETMRTDKRREENGDNGKTTVIVVSDNDDDPTQPSYACLLPVATGDCKSYQNKWFFNRYAGRCEMFFYGGCGGNANRFENLQLCIRTCIEPQRRGMPVDMQPHHHPEHHVQQQRKGSADAASPPSSTSTVAHETQQQQQQQQQQHADTPREEMTTAVPSDTEDVIYVTSPMYIPMTRDDLEAANLDVDRTSNADQIVLVPSSTSRHQQPPPAKDADHGGKQPEMVNGHVASTMAATSTEASELREETNTEENAKSGDQRLTYVMGLTKPYLVIVSVLGIVGVIVVVLIIVISIIMCRKVRRTKRADIVEDVIKTHVYGDLSHVIYNEPAGKTIDEKL